MARRAAGVTAGGQQGPCRLLPGSGQATRGRDRDLRGRLGLRESEPVPEIAHAVGQLRRGRVAAAYAPGLDPMDFHPVVETAIGGERLVWDATRLAPRQSLVRVATGRDAADVAFRTVLSGTAALVDLAITAVANGDLPTDDHEAVVRLS